MPKLRWLTISCLLLIALPATAMTQARAVVIFGQAGRMYPVVNLSSEDGDDMSPGRSYGGGLGLQIGPKTALRAIVNLSKSSLRGPTVNLGDPTFTRFYCGLDLMFGSPSEMGLAPYLFFGGGRVTADPAEPGVDASSKVSGRLGAGVNYVPDNSFIVLFVEASGWLYEFELLGFKKLQFNSAVLGGLAFAVPY